MIYANENPLGWDVCTLDRVIAHAATRDDAVSAVFELFPDESIVDVSEAFEGTEPAVWRSVWAAAVSATLKRSEVEISALDVKALELAEQLIESKQEAADLRTTVADQEQKLHSFIKVQNDNQTILRITTALTADGMDEGLAHAVAVQKVRSA